MNDNMLFVQTTLIILKILYIVCNREFIEHDIVQFAKENPHAALYLKPRRNRSPVVVAEYCKYLKSNKHSLRYCRECVPDKVKYMS